MGSVVPTARLLADLDILLTTHRWRPCVAPDKTRSTSNSTLPPVGFSPNSRALMHLGVIEDQQVAGVQQ
jgi:hypothetical protein